ncbi:MAG TPA: glycosyl hydrolase family 8 [Polyangiaceae bacterium]|nr:glycosyl hydrolase family 8 [Polyangiaceae bacterium]
MHYRQGFSRIVNVALCAGLAAGAVSLGTARTASAQTQFTGSFPFPSRKPVMGLTTDVLTTHELRAQYELWKSRFIERCGQGDARIKYPESNNDTRSEGVGYGMVIAAYFGDQPTFDGLWDYYQRASSNGLMNWRRDGCAAGGGGGDTGSAADADIDAAFGLIVANKQWGGYDSDITGIVGQIRSRLFLPACQGILLAGSQFAACGCINPSYIPPGYYRAFGTVDQAQFWTTARDNSYTYFAAVSDNNTGLVPAWSQSNGSLQLACNGTPQVSGGGQTNEFQADAARTPWRVAMDYQWTGDARAKQFLTDIGNFAARQRIVQIVTRYSLAGAALEGGGDATGFRSTYTIGGFASAMTATTQENLDAFTGAWQSMYLAGDSTGPNNTVSPHAFNSSLALLYGLTITGMAWDPTGANPAPVAEPPVSDQPGNLLKNGDFDEGFLNWSMANLSDGNTPAGARAEGYAMHKNGQLQVRIQRTSAAKNAYEVRLSQPVSVTMGKNYLISFKASSPTPRPIHIGVDLPAAPYTQFGSLGNRRDATEDAPVMLSSDLQTYTWVFTSSGTANANFDIDLGDSEIGVTLDDVFFGETTQPPSVPGEGAGETPVTTPDPTAPGGGTTTPGGGTTTPGGGTSTGSTPSGGGLGTIPNQGDATSSPAGGPATSSGGGSAPISGGMPPAPTTRVSGNGTCTTDADCASAPGARCSTKLWLCFDPTTGYVADPTSATGWSQPPRMFDEDGDHVRDDDCGFGNVWWEVMQGCYDPVSGYAFNPSTKVWVWVGENYVKGQLGDGGSSDSGCSVSNGVGSEPEQRVPLALGIALGAAATLRHRRRARR